MNALGTGIHYLMLTVAILAVAMLGLIILGLVFQLVLQIVLFIVRVLTEERDWDPNAYFAKGGQNQTYQISDRPPPPAPMPHVSGHPCYCRQGTNLRHCDGSLCPASIGQEAPGHPFAIGRS